MNVCGTLCSILKHIRSKTYGLTDEMIPRVACYGRLSIQVYRHGDRAPTKKLPIDIYNESYWDYGYGELTNVSSVRLMS